LDGRPKGGVRLRAKRDKGATFVGTKVQEKENLDPEINSG